MSTLLNIIWLVLAGFWLALGYLLAGVVCCILIITIPFGIASFRIAGYALWPCGRTTGNRWDAGVGSAIGNVI
ncbi:MAG: YccF domain-containing protein, partial [Jiangellaceae bacterium]